MVRNFIFIFVYKCVVVNVTIYLLRKNFLDQISQVGNEVGKNFGWIGHSNCSKQCPTSCEARNWKYWNGVTGGEGDWDKDEYLRIDGM